MGSLPLLKFDKLCLLGVMVASICCGFLILSTTKGLHTRFGCFAGC